MIDKTGETSADHGAASSRNQQSGDTKPNDVGDLRVSPEYTKRHRARKSQHPGPFFYFPFVIFLAVAFILSLNALTQSFRFADIIAKSDQRLTAAPSLTWVNRAMKRVVVREECRSDILSIGLALLLRTLDHSDPDKDFDAWQALISQATTYLEHAIRCSPADGNLHARFAYIALQSGAADDTILAAINRSVVLSPADSPVVRFRFAIWRRASAELLHSARPALEHDLLIAAKWFSLADLRSAVVGASPYFKQALANWIRAQDTTVQARMKQIDAERPDPRHRYRLKL